MANESKEKYCYVRFFNGAQDAETMNIYINDELVEKNLAGGTFTPFRRAKPGVYNMEVRIEGDGTHMDYSELVSLMEDVAYTLAMTGDANHLGMAVLTLDINHDGWRPNLRFANLLGYDSVIDIEMDKQKAVTGLMFRETSDEIEVVTGHYDVAVFDADADVILQDKLHISESGVYLGILYGESGNAQHPPRLSVAEDSPIL